MGALADLAYPKAVLPQLQDTAYLLALESGIRAALEEQPGEYLIQSMTSQVPWHCSFGSSVGALANMAHPQAAQPQMQDTAYLLALEDGIRAALEEQPGMFQISSTAFKTCSSMMLWHLMLCSCACFPTASHVKEFICAPVSRQPPIEHSRREWKLHQTLQKVACPCGGNAHYAMQAPMCSYWEEGARSLRY